MMKKASIIIRTKNEEKWISICLNAIFKQDYKNFEVIIVDNCSTDKTVEKAKEWNVKVVTLKEFKPGNAINYGIENSSGDYLICLSAHCIPKEKDWLKNLVSDLEDENIAGVYGKQVPTSSSHYLDKRDLFLTFGNDKRVQEKDSFFHNANSAFTRKTWEKFRFDDEVTNIEDRIWGKEVIKNKLKIVYEPDAVVFHHHGIHQEADKKRAKKIVQIMEADEFKSENLCEYKGKTKDILIIFDREKYDNFRLGLLRKVISDAKKSSVFEDIVFCGIDKKALKQAEESGLNIFDRSTKDYDTSLNDVLKDCLLDFENQKYIPNSITLSSVNYPFRDQSSFKNLVDSFYESAFLPTLYSHEEKRICFTRGEESEIAINNQLLPRELEESSVMICPFGFGCTLNASDLRNGNFLQKRVNLIPQLNQADMIEISTEEEMSKFEVKFE